MSMNDKVEDSVEQRKKVLAERLEQLKSGKWPHKNTCLNIECTSWTETECKCSGDLGCCD